MNELRTTTRLRLLKIWEMLLRESDEEHPLSTVEMIDRLRSMGISCDRRTLYADIKLLQEEGYDISVNRKKVNEYYLGERQFSVPELHFLIDAVQGATFIPEQQSEILIRKIAKLAGSRAGEVIKSNTVAFNTTKHSNHAIFYIINEIAYAIENKKKLEYYYFDYDERHRKVYRRDKERYCVDPYATIFSDDNYYLLCFDDRHEGMAHYRIDRMEQVTATETPMSGRDGVTQAEIVRHKKEVFHMFKGEPQQVVIRIDRSLLDVMYDKFGENLYVWKIGDQFEFSVNVQVSVTFFAWCCSFGDRLKLISPFPTVERLKEYIRSLAQCYSGQS